MVQRQSHYVFRYRRVNGVFSYTKLTDDIILDSSIDWSVTYDWSYKIRDIDIDSDTDELAISTVYALNGASDNVRALQVTINTGKVDRVTSASSTPNNILAWPPV